MGVMIVCNVGYDGFKSYFNSRSGYNLSKDIAIFRAIFVGRTNTGISV